MFERDMFCHVPFVFKAKTTYCIVPFISAFISKFLFSNKQREALFREVIEIGLTIVIFGPVSVNNIPSTREDISEVWRP